MVLLNVIFIIWDPSPAPLPTRAQRPIKPSNTVHILPVLRLLLLPHPGHIVSLHLCILRRLEPREAHRSAHLRHLGIRVRIHFHGVLFLLRNRLGRRSGPVDFGGGFGEFVCIAAGRLFG